MSMSLRIAADHREAAVQWDTDQHRHVLIIDGETIATASPILGSAPMWISDHKPAAWSRADIRQLLDTIGEAADRLTDLLYATHPLD